MTLLARVRQPVSTRWRLAGLLATAAALLLLDVWQRPASVQPPRAAWPAGVPAAGAAAWVPAGHGSIPMPANTPAAHASSLLALPPSHDASLLAFWFAGDHESAEDVQIAMSAFDRASQQWQAARFVVNRHEAGAALGFGLRRLGNPVAWQDAKGCIHLFVVATGMGGWAASRVLHLRQADGYACHDLNRLRFEPLRVLPLSWLWNTSHLVRSAPLPLRDGGMLLPVYFELGAKYPVALRFDAGGGFIGMQRMSNRRDVLQPTLLPLSDTHWLALMRDQSARARVAVVETEDGGQSWRDAPDLPLRNDDSSVIALALRPDLQWLAHNTLPHSRAVLELSRASSGRDWSPHATLEAGKPPDEYSYPAMAWADGALWVSYTDQRKRIGWQRFAPAPTQQVRP